MWSHERTRKLAMAAGTMGLFLLAPSSTGLPPWLLLGVLCLPLALYLVGGMIEEDAAEAPRQRLGARVARWGAVLYAAWFVVLGFRALRLFPAGWLGGLVLGAFGLFPVFAALRRRGRG